MEPTAILAKFMRCRFLIAVLGGLCASHAAFAQEPDASTIILRGSDTLGAKLVPQWAEAFKKKNPSAKFDIAAEGTSTAFTNLASRACRIGMATRVAKPAELEALGKAGVRVEAIEVAKDQLLIAVNAANPITGLSSLQVEKLFEGDIRGWSELGGAGLPVQAYTRNTASGTYKDFQILAMRGREYGASSLKMAGGEQPVQLVAGDAGGITYLGLAYARAKKIKVLPIDGAHPGKSAANPPYPFERACYLYLSSEATPMEREFVRFTQAPQGQEILAVLGFLPPVLSK